LELSFLFYVTKYTVDEHMEAKEKGEEVGEGEGEGKGK